MKRPICEMTLYGLENMSQNLNINFLCPNLTLREDTNKTIRTINCRFYGSFFLYFS